MADMQQADIVGNYLGNLYAAQDRVQKQQDAQFQRQRQIVADDRASKQFDQQNQIGALTIAKARHDNLVSILGRSTDEASFQQGIQQATLPVEQGGLGLPAEQLTGLTFAKDYQRLRQEAGVTGQELDMKIKEAQLAHTQAATAALRAKPQGGSALAQNAAERAQLAQALGIDPRSDAGKRYILTGQMPNGLTPADRNAVQDADQKVLATSQGIDMLKQARSLSDKASQGYGANTISQGLSLIGDETANNTIEFDNLLQSQVLPQLKVIFGGAPTEGERAILLQLQGSSTLGREVRGRILDRAIKMAEQRLKFYNDQSQGIRGGTYYTPGQGPLAGSQTAAPPAAAAPAPKAPPPPPGFKVIQ